MIFNSKKHNSELYTTLLTLSRNIYFYSKLNLKDTYETRIYLMFIHFSLILIIYKKKKIKFPQFNYDSLFHCIENNLRELGFGDVAVNKKMKELNKVFYDILLKIVEKSDANKLNKKLVFKYFLELNDSRTGKYELFEHYFAKFYNFCFELTDKSMIKDALKFRL
tara:strand:- start:130 stop:624 length:495 start_codon:yes stop_codon:yes gene_type:complete